MFRAPIMLVSTTIMAISINKDLAVVFLVAIPILGVALYFIASRTYPKFLRMLKKYDKLNLDIQENLTGIRVVEVFCARRLREGEIWEYSGRSAGSADERPAYFGLE